MPYFISKKRVFSKREMVTSKNIILFVYFIKLHNDVRKTNIWKLGFVGNC